MYVLLQCSKNAQATFAEKLKLKIMSFIYFMLDQTKLLRPVEL